MLDHNAIIRSTLIQQDGMLIDVNKEVGVYYKVFDLENVHPEYVNLLRSSGFMYTTLQLQYEAINEMVNRLEAVGVDALTPELLNMQSGLNIAMRIALEGFEKVETSLQNKKF